MPQTKRSVVVGELAAAADDGLVSLEGAPDTPVSGVAYDSRAVAPGDLFFCVPGAKSDGHDWAAAAAAAGAAALCVERALGLGLPEILVTDVRRSMGPIAAAFFGHPAKGLKLYGVTGTNGKTTTAYLLDSILRADGQTTGLIGTIETRVGGRVRPGTRTTPESVDLQALLAEMLEAGVEAVVMEVTSHALALHRVAGLFFEATAFTNLSQDHLDFHAGMDDYFEAKRSLFLPDRTAAAVVNIDDPYGRAIKAASAVRCYGYGLDLDAELSAGDIELGPHGTELTIVPRAEPARGDGGAGGDALLDAGIAIQTPLIGAFNVSNLLAAAALALAGGVGVGAVKDGLENVEAVPGRFEAVDRGQPFTVVVDYAHTPEALDNVLREARRLASAPGSSVSGRVLCAFGCGGDRDRGKRPLMGMVAARLADIVVVTSDNPRSEGPVAIIDQILEGIVAERAGGADGVFPDRAEAIAFTVRAALPGDVVVIAGKGHETGQELSDRIVPFDDRVAAAEALDDLAEDTRELR